MNKHITSFLFAALLTANAVAQCDGGHNTNPADAWLSCTGLSNPNADRSQEHWIHYDFGANYLLGTSILWNYNVPSETGNGLQDVVIDYSMDGVEWIEWGTYTLNEAPGTEAYLGDMGPDFDGVEARYLLISAATNYGGSCYGFAELKVEVEPGSVGVDEPAAPLLQFGLYPNPTRGACVVQMQTWQDATIRLLDLEGALIQSLRPTSPTTQMDLSSLPAGMYLVQVVLANGTYATKRIAVTG